MDITSYLKANDFLYSVSKGLIFLHEGLIGSTTILSTERTYLFCFGSLRKRHETVSPFVSQTSVEQTGLIIPAFNQIFQSKQCKWDEYEA